MQKIAESAALGLLTINEWDKKGFRKDGDKSSFVQANTSTYPLIIVIVFEQSYDVMGMMSDIVMFRTKCRQDKPSVHHPSPCYHQFY